MIADGSGFIRNKVTKALLEKGYQVLIVDIQKPSVEDPLLSFLLLDIAVSKLLNEYGGTQFGIITLPVKVWLVNGPRSLKKKYMTAECEYKKFSPHKSSRGVSP